MYAYMTHQLMNICPRVLVVQEGGYNVDFIGQHASGVVRALIAGPKQCDTIKEIQKHLDISPAPADIDVGLYSMADINEAKCKGWAMENVKATASYHRKGWKFLE